MTHEEYLAQLMRGFAGEPSVPLPHYGGANEEDAICRWLAYHVAHYLLQHGNFELDERGRMLEFRIDRVWRRWRSDHTEDVDLTGFGRRNGSRQSSRLKACVTGNGGRLLLRVSDWSSRQAVDIEGVRRDESHGGVRIADPGEPLLWTLPRTTRAGEEAPASESDDVTQLPRCCQDSLESIARILESGSALSEVLAAAPYIVVTLGRTPRPSVLGLLWKLGSGGTGYLRLRQRTRELTDVIVRERVRTVIQLELLDHNESSTEGRHWARMLETFQ